MPSRAELNLRANAVNVDHTTYPNDSKLEQAVIYAETQLGSSGAATTIAAAAADVAKVAGGKNV